MSLVQKCRQKIVCNSQNTAMIYVKVALKDYDDQDIQYTEVPEGTPDSFPVTELPDRAWAVKEPSDAVA